MTTERLASLIRAKLDRRSTKAPFYPDFQTIFINYSFLSFFHSTALFQRTCTTPTSTLRCCYQSLFHQWLISRTVLVNFVCHSPLSSPSLLFYSSCHHHQASHFITFTYDSAFFDWFPQSNIESLARGLDFAPLSRRWHPTRTPRGVVPTHIHLKKIYPLTE